MKNKKNKQQLKPLNAPVYRYWQALYLSFYSSKLYIDVFKRWRGFGLLYFLFVIALACIPLSVRIISDFNIYYNQQVLLPIQKLPPLMVQKGETILEKPMPYLMKNPKGQIIGIVDTSGKVTSKTAAYPDLRILITKNKYIFYPSEPQFFFGIQGNTEKQKVYEFSFDERDNEVFYAAEWIQASKINWLKLGVEALIYPIIVFFFYFMLAVFLIVFAFLGQLFSQTIYKLKLTFKESSRLIAVAATLPTFLLFITLAINMASRRIGFILIILISIYFSHAIISIKRQAHNMVIS